MRKIFFRELFWWFLGLTVSVILVVIIFPPADIYVSDIYVGRKPVEMSIVEQVFNPGTLFSALLFSCPVLFLIYFVRACVNRFSSAHLNILLTVFCCLSLVISSLAAYFRELIFAMVNGGGTIYPPLSSLPEKGSQTLEENFGFVLWVFVAFHLLVLTSLIYRMSIERKK